MESTNLYEWNLCFVIHANVFKMKIQESLLLHNNPSLVGGIPEIFPHLIYEERDCSFYGNQEYGPSKSESSLPQHM